MVFSVLRCFRGVCWVGFGWVLGFSLNLGCFWGFKLRYWGSWGVWGIFGYFGCFTRVWVGFGGLVCCSRFLPGVWVFAVLFWSLGFAFWLLCLVLCCVISGSVFDFWVVSGRLAWYLLGFPVLVYLFIWLWLFYLLFAFI